MTITCNACGSPVEGRIVDASSYDNPGGKEKEPWRCSNPGCVHRDPRRQDYVWYTEHQ